MPQTPQATVDELIKNRDAAVRMVNKIDRALAKTGKRESQRSLMRDRRRAETAVIIGEIANKERRLSALADPFEFFRTYGRETFTRPFADNHRHMVQAIIDCATTGGDQAIAAPRGEGKSSLTVFTLIFLMLNQIIKFPLIVGQTGEKAAELYNSFKSEFERNDVLAADFPEICDPVRALEGAPQRGNAQRCFHDEQMTHIEWKAAQLVFPTVRGVSPDHRNYGDLRLKFAGLDGAIRGTKIHARRPDFIIIDDPETRESADSDHMIAQRRTIIDQDLAGLGGQTKRAPRIILCTIQNRKCLAYEYTNPEARPSYNGKRFGQILDWPTDAAMALWNEYIYERKAEQRDGSKACEKATEFYRQRFDAMNDGARIANPHRFDSATEISALQACFNYIADNDMESFLTEWQNDPPSKAKHETAGLTAHAIEGKVNGYAQGQLPADAPTITAAIDLGRYGCHWAAVGWTEDAAGLIFDYGVQELNGQISANTPAPMFERALFNALLEFRDHMLAMPVPPALVVIDSGNWTDVVYEFIRQVQKPFIASKGFAATVYHGGKTAPDRIVGQHWFAHLQAAENVWLYGLNVDEWKAWTHQRFLTPTHDDAMRIRAGSLSLFSPERSDKRKHNSFAHHIVAEELREEFVPGRGVKRQWFKVNRNNHWLDVMAMNCAAANMLGVKLPITDRTAQPAIVRPQPQRADKPAQSKFDRPFLISRRS